MPANHEPATTDVDVVADLYAAFARRDLDTIRAAIVHVWRLASGRPIGYDVHLDTAAKLAALRGETVA
jgi:hypothetical protein